MLIALRNQRSPAFAAPVNTSASEPRVTRGENNKFTPVLFDRGQPQVVARGTDWYFKLTSDGCDLTWHIDGVDLKISAKKLAEPRNLDGGWESWTVEKDREQRNAIDRCSSGFAPDPESFTPRRTRRVGSSSAAPHASISS